MVNYHDYNVLEGDAVAMSKFWYAVGGLYFWEFFITLDYEWSVIRGHRPLRWTIWVYSATRILTIIAVILTLLGFSAARFNCEAKVVCHLLFMYLAISSASLLIVLRILAIWNRKKIIVAIAGGAWVINVIIQIQTIARIRSTSVPNRPCGPTNLRISLLNTLVTLVTDISLLLIMIFGLLRLGFHERGAFGLGRLLWKQGVIWLLVATIAEVPPAVFLSLNLNSLFNPMFLPPSVVTLSIAATRIYRSLADHSLFSCTNNVSGLETSERGGRLEWRVNRVPITLSCVEVTTNRTYDQDQTPQTSQNGSLACIGKQLCEKPGKQYGLDESAKNDEECQRQASS